MSLIRDFISRIRARRTSCDPNTGMPIISTQWGPVTESARKQAAENMRRDPSIRHRVEQKIIEECGGDVERGRAEFRRRYPEVFR